MRRRSPMSIDESRSRSTGKNFLEPEAKLGPLHLEEYGLCIDAGYRSELQLCVCRGPIAKSAERIILQAPDKRTSWYSPLLHGNRA